MSDIKVNKCKCGVLKVVTSEVCGACKSKALVSDNRDKIKAGNARRKKL
jgi:hypothetical protein